MALVLAYEPQWLENLLDPRNPFVPWLLLTDLCAILVHVYLVWWVYRDAAWRYNRGAPWGLITALIPVAGWMFYLAYRNSPLVEFDRLEAEDFDADHEWTDYDTYKANRGQAWFKDLFTRDAAAGEVKRKVDPGERLEVRRLRAERKAEARRKRAERIAGKREQRRQRKVAARERQTVVGAHGEVSRLSDRKQRALHRQLAVVEQLKTLPREDTSLEDLIYEMKYAEALKQAQEALEVAREMNDAQGVVTYEAYVQRLEGLIAKA